jgi:hypothetical protein
MWAAHVELALSWCHYRKQEILGRSNFFTVIAQTIRVNSIILMVSENTQEN